jgi:fused signal recognition particle receptor
LVEADRSSASLVQRNVSAEFPTNKVGFLIAAPLATGSVVSVDSSGSQWIYLILIAGVIAFGLGVLWWSKRSSSPLSETPSPARSVETSTAVETEPEEISAAPEPEPRGMRERLGRARAALGGALGSVLGRSAIDADTWDELEEALLLADIGIAVTTDLLDALRSAVESGEIADPESLVVALRDEMTRRLDGANRSLARRDDSGPSIWLFVGVNGVGKTTTIGKLASRETAGGVSTLLAAGDTFRAAAAEQLTMWGERAGVEVVRGSEGGDPSSVVYDAVERAAARGIDLVLADTAGRLHTKSNLMDELSKVRRVAEKGAGVVTETLLVIDATTGQNGLVQAREFREATDVTGVVVTKLDGSAKGGIVFAIETELGIPVKLIGVGEGVDDLIPFDPSEFVDALVGR